MGKDRDIQSPDAFSLFTREGKRCGQHWVAQVQDAVTVASLLNLVSLDEAGTAKDKHRLHAPIEPISDAHEDWYWGTGYNIHSFDL